MLSERQKQLLMEGAKNTQASAYAKGTMDNFMVHWALYFNFCQYFEFSSLPAQSKVVVLYIQFLSMKLTALTSIKNYVARVRTLHNLL